MCSSRPLRRLRGPGAGQARRARRARRARLASTGLNGLVCSVPSFGVFACLSDFGACDIDAFPPIPLSAAHARLRAPEGPVKFIEDVVPLALESGIKGPFMDTTECCTSAMRRRPALRNWRLSARSRAAGSFRTEGAEFARLRRLRLCCDVHEGTAAPMGALKKRPEKGA
jgi:hypothetical protein